MHDPSKKARYEVIKTLKTFFRGVKKAELFIQEVLSQKLEHLDPLINQIK
jgi:hypothetical protein